MGPHRKGHACFSKLDFEFETEGRWTLKKGLSTFFDDRLQEQSEDVAWEMWILRVSYRAGRVSY